MTKVVTNLSWKHFNETEGAILILGWNKQADTHIQPGAWSSCWTTSGKVLPFPWVTHRDANRATQSCTTKISNAIPSSQINGPPSWEWGLSSSTKAGSWLHCSPWPGHPQARSFPTSPTLFHIYPCPVTPPTDLPETLCQPNTHPCASPIPSTMAQTCFVECLQQPEASTRDLCRLFRQLRLLCRKHFLRIHYMNNKPGIISYWHMPALRKPVRINQRK